MELGNLAPADISTVRDNKCSCVSLEQLIEFPLPGREYVISYATNLLVYGFDIKHTFLGVCP